MGKGGVENLSWKGSMMGGKQTIPCKTCPKHDDAGDAGGARDIKEEGRRELPCRLDAGGADPSAPAKLSFRS